MLFNSYSFLFVFLPLIVLVYFSCHRFFGVWWAIVSLLSASLIFYGLWNWKYLSLLSISIAFNYIAGELLRKKKNAYLLSSIVAINLLILGVYKYADFFLLNVNTLLKIELELPGFLLPLAISFYTFQQIGYIVDCYRGGVAKHGICQYVLFVSFFPQLIAGPILRHKEIFSQYKKSTFGVFNIGNFSVGFGIFALGLFKKTVIGDNLGRFSDALFAGAGSDLTLSFFESWAAALFFSFQIYFDFSGYSDMAVGLGRMFNIRLPFNFESPYRSSNIIDFWRRWHITLGRFLRSYLYIPLGGSRGGLFRHSANLLIVMCLGGIWHGAGWTFLVWGAYHGVLLMICHLLRRYRVINSRVSNSGREGVFRNVLSISATFLLVTIGWTLFRAPDLSSAYNIFLGLAGLQGIIFDSLGNIGSIKEYLFSQELFQQGIQLFPNDTIDFFNEGIYWLLIAAVVTFALPNVRTIIDSQGLCFFNLPLIRNINRSVDRPWYNVKLVLLGTLMIFLVALLFVDAELEFLYFQF